MFMKLVTILDLNVSKIFFFLGLSQLKKYLNICNCFQERKEAEQLNIQLAEQRRLERERILKADAEAKRLAEIEQKRNFRIEKANRLPPEPPLGLILNLSSLLDSTIILYPLSSLYLALFNLNCWCVVQGSMAVSHYNSVYPMGNKSIDVFWNRIQCGCVL